MHVVRVPLIETGTYLVDSSAPHLSAEYPDDPESCGNPQHEQVTEKVPNTVLAAMAMMLTTHYSFPFVVEKI